MQVSREARRRGGALLPLTEPMVLVAALIVQTSAATTFAFSSSEFVPAVSGSVSASSNAAPTVTAALQISVDADAKATVGIAFAAGVLRCSSVISYELSLLVSWLHVVRARQAAGGGQHCRAPSFLRPVPECEHVRHTFAGSEDAVRISFRPGGRGRVSCGVAVRSRATVVSAERRAL